MHGQDAGDLREGILRAAEEPSDHSRSEDEGRHIINRRDWHGHEPLRDGKPSFIMGGTEASQRPVKQDHQVTAHHTRESLPETDNHPMRMGRQPNQGLLLQPFLLPSDASQKKEQDESGGGHITQNARLRLAHP